MRFYLHILLVWVTVFTLSATSVSGASVGSWQMYPNFGQTPVDMVDTPHRVYFASQGNLFHYDKDTQDLYGYTPLADLSDVDVSGIWRNYDRDYVVVAYSGGNMDLIDGNGEIVNMPDIKDAQYVTSHAVNDMAFSGDIGFVATGFGLVRYDMKRHAVSQSGIYNIPVSSVTVAGDRLLMLIDGELFYTFVDAPINDRTDFVSLGALSASGICAMADGYIAYIDTEGEACGYVDIDWNTSKIVADKRFEYFWSPERIRPYGDGAWIASSRYSFHIFRYEKGELQHYTHDVAPDMKAGVSRILYCGDFGKRTMWYVNPEGFGGVEWNDGFTSAVPSVVRMMPGGTNLSNGITRMAFGRRGLYLHNVASNRVPNYNDEYNVRINLFADGFFTDISPDAGAVSVTNGNSGGKFRRPTVVLEDPEDRSVMYIGSWFEGIVRMADGRQTAKFDWTNMPLPFNYFYYVIDMNFDAKANLWVYVTSLSDPVPWLLVLPAAKRASSVVHASDWIRYPTPGFGTKESRNSPIMICRHERGRGMVFVSEGWDNGNLMTIDTNSTPLDTSDDRVNVRSSFIDQDGKTFTTGNIYSMVEDNDGAVWLGTGNGVFVIRNPRSMVSDECVVERVKVPRNDGTQLADYLLANETVPDIAVDGAGRKWFATLNSGLYLVSPDGRTVLRHFNADNSPLSSDMILCVETDPADNTVYVGTPFGLMTYASDAVPPAGDFSGVMAYPNPVRPDYHGWITIKGLMDNSLVKIADTQGNVIFTARSEGGMVTWDGCSASGDRVRTGVYLVLASSGGTDGQPHEGVVTKILVVN